MTASQTLRELLTVVAGEVKTYQLILNFDKSDVLKKATDCLLELYPTTAIKKVVPGELAREFLVSDHCLYIVVTGNDREPLETLVLEHKRKATPFVILDIQELNTSSEKVTVFLTRGGNSQTEFVRSTYIFNV